jgi:uncharacterized protein (TIGR02453 family)
MSFSGFPLKSLDFLRKIRNNNNKEWFEAHRAEYEKLILEPSRAFVEEMGDHLMALEPTINAEPKINKSLFRIFRDTRRMGSNKEPLKSRIGIIFWQGRAKRLQSSSFYMHFSPDELFVSAGVRWFEKPLLDAYREYILDEQRRVALHKLLEYLQAKGYKILPEGYKRFPRGFDSSMEAVELSLYKGMASYIVLDPSLLIEGEKLIDTLYKIYEDMLPLQQIMYEISTHVKED